MKFKFLFIILSFFYSFTLTAQEKFSLWQDTKDDFRKKAVELYYYPAPDSINNHCAIVFCPGGSYCYLAKKNEGHDPAKKFNQLGFNSFVLIYRRGIKGNRYPSQIQDLHQALIFVADNYKFDKIGVCGFSAGGHLAGTSAFYYNKNFVSDSLHNLRPDFAIMIYPVISMNDEIGHRKSRRNLLGQYYKPEDRELLSLENNVNPNSPPIFLLVCKDDPIVDYRNSVVFDKALNSNGVLHYFDFNEVGGHGFGVNPDRIKSPDKTAALWYERFMIWWRNIERLPKR